MGKEGLKKDEECKSSRQGPDSIPVEIWKCLGDENLNWLTGLFDVNFSDCKAGPRMGYLYTKTRMIFRTAITMEV